MKATTLNDILERRSEVDVLKLKCNLIQFKKSGYLFIKENISDLEISQPFEIYYAPTRGGITYKNAFPISIRAYFEKEIVSILAT